MPSVRLLLAILLCVPSLLSSYLSAQGRPPTPVIVAEVLTKPFAEEFSVLGRIQPRRASLVATETEGLTIQRFIDSGQTVKRGETLFLLKNDELTASLAEAEADFALRQANHRQSIKLRATDTVSEQALRDDAYELARARAKLNGLKAQVDNLSIRAPFPGHIIQTFTSVGQWVSRGGDIARVIYTDTVRVYVNVSEQHVSHLQLGAEAEISVDALGGAPVKGRIIAILAEGYQESRTFPVVVQTANPDGMMRSNMSARVQFRIAKEPESVLVHKDALVSGPMGQVVYLARDGKAISRPVQTGLAHQGFVAVSGDLQAGDLAVVRGNERLRDGQDIRIIRKHQ